MTPKNPKTQKNHKFRCQNPACKTLTDSPAIFGAKRYCRKCDIHRRVYKELPSKRYIDAMKREGLWKL